ncbi:MAG: DUF2851 family protein [Paraprevotella sp.]|nr:DUF2851 family protein [Paraprevotella sp.]
MEKLLHYVWRHKIFPLAPLYTDTGESVEVIDPGQPNTNAGPDFFNAKIKFNGTLWVGNVEIHRISSDWFRHGHDCNPAYNNVILHVVETRDTDVTTADGKTIPQLTLSVPEKTREDYETLRTMECYPRCAEIILELNDMTVHSWLSALLCERLAARANRVTERMQALSGDWETAFFITLARNFGFGLNGDSFERWAGVMPLSAAAKHRDNLFQLEALFLGQAGLLAPEAVPAGCRQEATSDPYFNRLSAEYSYLAHKFSLTPLSCHEWKYLRLRPQNFPHIRLSQLAQLYYGQKASFSRILEITDMEELRKCLQCQATSYWETHYIFGKSDTQNEKQLTRGSLNLIIINTVIPVLYAYGMQHGNEHLCERAMEWLEELPAENNHIIRQWKMCGLKVKSAADSQALIQLKQAYCDTRDCLRCRFGYEYLNRNHTYFTR